MAATGIPYRKLPGAKRGILHRASLWLGADHLLAVSGWRFSESYKRYYFCEIQAVTITRMPRGVVPLWWLAALLATLAGWILTRHYGGWSHLVGLLSFVGVLAYLPVVAFGLSCRCRIQTAVSCDELPSLYRLWTARKALAILETQIAPVQGVLAEGWIDAVPLPESSGATQEATRAPSAHDPAGAKVSPFELALYLSLIAGIALWFHSLPGVIAAVILLAEVSLTVVVLAQNRKRGSSGAARLLAVAALIFVSGTVYANTIVSSVAEIRDASIQNRVTVGAGGFQESPVMRNIYVGGCLGLAVAGLLSVPVRIRRG